MEIRLDGILSLLEAAGIAYALLPVGAGRRAVLTERWGRILGPFDAEGRSFLWLNPEIWSSGDAFSRALAEGSWNVGGERFWLAPEIRLNIKDRADFWGSYELPAAMDPGSWRLEADPAAAGGDGPSAGLVRLSMEARLPLYNPRGGSAAYRVERSIAASPNPLRGLRSRDALMAGVEYCGYIHRTRLSLLPGSDPAARLEAWTLCQLVPEGSIILPCAAEPEYEDYYEKADASCLALSDGALRFSVTGKRRYKVGVRAASHFGRAGYLKRPSGAGSAAAAAASAGAAAGAASAPAELLVRAFTNDPASEYVEEPDSLPGCRGLSFHVYNDGGAFGGFGELECNGRTVGVDAGGRSAGGGTAGQAAGGPGGGGVSVRGDEFSFWLFRGPLDRIEAISRTLLGTAGRP